MKDPPDYLSRDARIRYVAIQICSLASSYEDPCPPHWREARELVDAEARKTA